MMQSLAANRMLWLLTAFLSLVAAGGGVSKPDIYRQVISADIMPGVFGQDVMTIAAAIIILLLAIRIKPGDSIKQMVILGILGYLFYAYGIYVIERVYTVMYFLYMAIFGLSFWALIYGVAKIRPEILPQVKLSRPMRNISAGFALLIALIFNILWVSQLLPLIQTGQKIEFLYSVYILDLCFIMPAFVIIGIMTLKKTGRGLLLMPAMFVLGFTLIFSLAVSELVKPCYHLSIDASGLGSSLVLSIVFLVLAFFHLRGLKINGQGA